MTKRILSIAAICAALLVAGWTAWWLYAASAIRASAADMAARGMESGVDLDYATLAVDGYPFALRARLDEVALTGRDGWTWDGAVVEATARPWNVLDVALRMPGAQRLRASTPLGLLVAESQDGHGYLSFRTDGRIAAASLTLRGLTANGDAVPSPLTAASATATLNAPRAAPRDYRDVGLLMSAILEDVALPEGVDAPLGRRVERMIFDAALMGPPPTRLDADALAAWSEAGGIVEVSRLDLAWGPLAMASEGAVALDSELQPMAALSARIAGYEPALDALAATGALDLSNVALAKMALNLMADRSDPTRPTLVAPIQIQDRMLSLGAVTLTRLPPIEWSGNRKSALNR